MRTVLALPATATVAALLQTAGCLGPDEAERLRT
jgi:hypothetical protein